MGVSTVDLGSVGLAEISRGVTEAVTITGNVFMVKDVQFEREYPSPPIVVTSIVSNNGNNNSGGQEPSTRIANVSNDGFTYVIKGILGASKYNVKVSWIAIPA